MIHSNSGGTDIITQCGPKLHVFGAYMSPSERFEHEFTLSRLAEQDPSRAIFKARTSHFGLPAMFSSAQYSVANEEERPYLFQKIEDIAPYVLDYAKYNVNEKKRSSQS